MAYFDLFVVTLNTITGPWDHSGYQPAFGDSSIAHSMHHLRSSCSYGGSAGFMDWSSSYCLSFLWLYV
eukprot:jgi/Galph1/1384/GphlegSOOS_G75.1